MGSATKHALAAVKTEVDGWQPGSLDAAEQFFDATDVISGSPALRAALADAGSSAEVRHELVERVFGSRIGDQAKQLLRSAVAQKWSTEAEFQAGLQELAVRAVAQASGEHERLGGELSAFVEAVGRNHDLELTLASRLTPVRAKVEIVDRVFGGRLSDAALAIVRRLVSNPLGRRVRRAIVWAVDLVADQSGRSVATVTTARALGDAQLDRLREGLSRRFGRPVTINQVVDPAIVGGLRVQLGDDVIDDSAAARIHQLRLQLA